MDNANRDPLAARAESAAKQTLIIQSLITALLAAALIGEIVTMLPRFTEGGLARLDNYAMLMLIAGVGLLTLLSALKLVYTVRDLRAARKGEVRVPPARERTLLMLLLVFSVLIILLGLILGGFIAAGAANIS